MVLTTPDIFLFKKIKSPGLTKMQVACEALWLAGYFFCLPWESRVSHPSFSGYILHVRGNHSL